VVTPVSLLVRLANGEEKKIRDTCGLGLEKPLADYDPITQSWKMFGDISLWGDCRLLLNLPPSGMTVSGVLFLQPAWVPITGETESLLWPTPTTQEVEHPTAQLTETGRRKSKDGTTSHSLGLADSVRMWPTPTAVTRPMEGNVRMFRAKIQSGEMTEQEAEAILGKSVWEAQGKIPASWPTPTASDHIERKSTQQTPGSMHSVSLPDAVRMWPTPTVDDANNVNPKPNRFHGLVAEVNQYPTPTYGKLAGGTGGFNQIEELYLSEQITLEEKKAMQAGNGGKLNPTWVEWLMGFPLGWTDLED
jgi:hypothetical protein